jgi:hypothetical protein
MLQNLRAAKECAKRNHANAIAHLCGSWIWHFFAPQVVARGSHPLSMMRMQVVVACWLVLHLTVFVSAINNGVGLTPAMGYA